MREKEIKPIGKIPKNKLRKIIPVRVCGVCGHALQPMFNKIQIRIPGTLIYIQIWNERHKLLVCKCREIKVEQKLKEAR